MIDTGKILANVCAKDLTRANLIRPMRFEVDGATYAAATNGHAAVVFRGVEVPATDGQLRASQLFDLMALDEAGASVTVAMTDLQAAAGAIAYGDDYECDECKGAPSKLTRKCDECKGTGEVPCECHCGDEHNAECEECEGTKTVSGCDKCDDSGTVKHTAESIYIHSRWFDKRLIAAVVRDMPDVGAVIVKVTENFLHVYGDGWAGVIMAYHENQKPVPAEAWPFPCEPTTDVTEWQRWLAVRRAVEAGK